MPLGLDGLPPEVLARTINHLARIDPVTALRMPEVSKNFREACKYATPLFDLCDVLTALPHWIVSGMHSRIADEFPRTRGLKTTMMTNAREDGCRSARTIAQILRACRCLRSMSIEMAHDARTVPPLDCVRWQRMLADAVRTAPLRRLTRLTLDLETHPGTEADTADLLTLLGPKLTFLSVLGLWVDQTGLAAISNTMTRLDTLCIDTMTLTLDFETSDGSDSLLADVLACARHHWQRAQLPVSRLVEFIKRWSAEFWFNGTRLLEWAIQSENVAFVRTLLEHGASPHKSGARAPSTPLLMAIETRNCKVARLLLKHGASPNGASNFLATTPLNLAVRRLNHDIVGLLFEYKVDPHAIDDFGMTPMNVAANHGFLAVMQLLLRLGVPATNTNQSTIQPLELACAADQPFCVTELLKHGASMSPTRPDRPCVLFRAVHSGRLAVSDALLAHGADANAEFDNVTVLCACIKRNDIAMVTMMIASGADVNRPSRESEENGIMSSPLHHAIEVGSFPIADLLLMHRADPDRMAGDGSTPLHRAVEKRLAGIVGTLLQHGANPAVPHGVTGRCALFPPA